MPTPQATNASHSSAGYGPNLHEIATSADLTEFGPYAEAIARWEKVTGRAAPLPQHPHADQAENHNSQHGSSNGLWACPTATSPAQT